MCCYSDFVLKSEFLGRFFPNGHGAMGWFVLGQ